MEYRSLDPTTGELFRSYPFSTANEMGEAIASADAAFADWSAAPVERRLELLGRLAGELESASDLLAQQMAIEMGKPLAQGRAEIDKCAAACRYYARTAADLLGESHRECLDGDVLVRRLPLGPILAIMPWNYPFWQFFRFAAAALASGNSVLLKHAPNTPGCSLAIVALLERAGAPPGLVQSLFLSNSQVASAIGDARVRGVTLTGSTAAGREVAALAGRHLKTQVLELGGCDPFIVFDDADLEKAAETAAIARCQNSGQSCIAAKRYLIEATVADEFADRVVAAMAEMRCGPPQEADVDLGPLARADLLERLDQQVDATLRQGANVRCGGERLRGPGFFYPPTLLDRVPDEAPAVREELFGPVAVLLPFADEAEAVERANETAYGLGAAIWTSDTGRARRIADRVQAGSVFINGMVRSDPEWPFGGVKDSGFGRELGREGVLEFTHASTLWMGKT